MPVLGRTKKDVLLEFRKNELLTAARAIFARKGFHDATIEEIAEAAEVAKGTVYLYYKSKKELYLEALRFGIESLNKCLAACATVSLGCEARLRALTRKKLEFFDENRDFFRIYYSELGKVPAHPAGVPLIQDLYVAQTEIFQRVLQDAIRSREIRKVDTEQTAHAIADMTRGVTIQRLLGHSRTSIEDDTTFVVDLIWKGITR